VIRATPVASPGLRSAVRRAGGGWAPCFVGPVVLGVIFALVLLTGSDFEIYVAGAIAIYALAAVGQGWLMGKAGQLSLGGGAIFACGAFSAALITNLDAPGTTAFPVPLVAAAAGGAVVGAVVAVPGLRFRGIYLLLATLALQYIVAFGGLKLQSRPEYLGGVPLNVGWGAGYVDSGQAIAACAGVVLFIVLVVLGRLYRSQAGREWSAIRENELRASVMGVNVRMRKMTAFIGSSAITGLAGGLYAYYIGLVSYSTFTLALALQFVIMAFVGGATTVTGPVIGAAIVTVLPYWLQDGVGAAFGSTWY
jgi:branched-chain amino acid transport system permease protein